MKFRKTTGVFMTLTILAAVSYEASAGDDEGFIYGKVTTRSGETYTGALRWGKQECFWDDIFNANKEENPWTKYLKRDKDKKKGEREYDFFGIKVKKYLGIASIHMFITQFGDIESIKVRQGNNAVIFMKNGSEYDVSGYGDVGESILILDDNLGKIKLKWKSIRYIEFMDTPRKVKREGYRLKGKVKTREMELYGYVMWDAEECISSDILDGDSEDGDMEIEFGNIRSIKRRGSRASQVTLKDGREYELHGSNDVNSENRGIFVYDPRYGKIEVCWDGFVEVIYEDKDDSGPDYKSYKPMGKLTGTVKTIQGDRFRGEIVYDLDETEGFEILNGKLEDMEFNIPFRNIAKIEPKGRYSSIVKLKNGETLRLDDSQDVSSKNDGILVFNDEGYEYIEWEDVELIEFK